MAKEEKPDPAPVDDEAEVFKTFGIDDDNAKRRVREMAAGRALFARRNKPAAPPKPEKKDDDPWDHGSQG